MFRNLIILVVIYILLSACVQPVKLYEGDKTEDEIVTLDNTYSTKKTSIQTTRSPLV